MKKLLLTLTVVIIMNFNVKADRLAPAVIPPISDNGITYKDHFESDGEGFAVYIVAQKSAGHAMVWKTKIFNKKFDKKLETDVQEVHLSSLKLEKDTLIATDEAGHRYEIAISSGKLLKP